MYEGCRVCLLCDAGGVYGKIVSPSVLNHPDLNITWFNGTIWRTSFQVYFMVIDSTINSSSLKRASMCVYMCARAGVCACV